MSLLLLANAQNKSSSKYACAQANPSSLCNASNRCGSESEPCVVDIRRKGSSATVKPNIPNAKSNAPFCVKLGTTVTWQTSAGNTGFVVDFGSSSPFDISGAMIGGSDRSISVVAKRAGCYLCLQSSGQVDAIGALIYHRWWQKAGIRTVTSIRFDIRNGFRPAATFGNN
jgi:hypothetical protein